MIWKVETVSSSTNLLAGIQSKSQLISDLMKGSVLEWIGFLTCLIAVVVLIWLVVRVRTWLQDDAGSAVGETEIWNQLQVLKQQGQLSEEEVRSINSRMLNSETETTQQQNDPSSN